MYFVYLAVCFLGFLPNTVFALPSAIPTQLMHPTTEAPSPQLILHPGIHPDEDLSDLENLKTKKSSSLYYAALPGSPMGGASVVKLTHLYPTVVLEHSHFVTAVTCNAASNSISVTFADPSSFRTAFDNWGAIRTGFLLISNVPGCGSGTDSLERSFHLISRLVGSEKDLRIVCQAQTIPIHHTVHRDQEIRVHAATYEVEHHRRSNQRNSHSAGATTAALSHPIHNTNTTFKKGGSGFVADQVPFDKHVDGTAAFNAQQIKPFDDTFGSKVDSYLLYRKHFGDATKGSKSSVQATNATNGTNVMDNSTSTTESSVEIFCVGCGIDVKLHVVANLVGTFGSGFTEANVKVNTNVTATLVLGIKANCKCPPASLVIPKILTIHAFALLDIGVDFSLELSSYLAAGFVCTWNDVGASLDLEAPDNSQMLGDWQLRRHCEKVIDAQAQLQVVMDPFVKFSLQIKAALLPDVSEKLTGQVSLVNKVSLRVTGTVSTEQEGDCSALEPRLQGALTSSVYVTAPGSKATRLHDPFSYALFDVCIPISGVTQIPTLFGNSSIPSGPSQVVPVDGGRVDGFKGDDEDDGGKLTTILWADRGSVVTWSGGSVFIRDDTDDSPSWISQEGLTYSTSTGDSLFVPVGFIEGLGFAKLETGNYIPEEGLQLGFGYPANETTYIAAADTDSTYYLMVCFLADGLGHLYVNNFTTGVPDMEADVQELLFAGSTTIDDVLCGYPYLTQY